MTVEQFVNLVSTTLNGSITAGATSLVIQSATGFPGSGNFRLNIDNELILVTAISGTTLTVTRGIEGTTAIAHTSGATVTVVLTAAALAALLSQNTGWNTAEDFDWTQGTSTSFNTDGNQSFGGLTFTKINSANEATHASAGGGAGLILSPSGGSAREWVSTNRTSPGMFLPMSGITALASSVTARTPLRIYAQVTQLSTQSADSYSDGLAIALAHSAEITSNSGLRNAYAGYLGFSGGNSGLVFNAYVSYGTTNSGGQSNIVGHKPTYAATTCLVEIPFGIVGGVVHMYGIYNNAVVVPWPAFTSFNPATDSYAVNGTANQLLERGWNGSTNTLAGTDPGDWGILLAMQNNVSQANQAQITRMRIDYFAGL